MWLRSNCSYTEEELFIIYHALLSYSVNLRINSDEGLKVDNLLYKIEKEKEFLINNNT